MKKMMFIALALLPLLSTSGCVTTNGQKGALGGAAVGAIAGQAIGHNTGGTLIGAAVGSLFGYMVGNEMDKADRARLNNAYETSPSQQTTQWVNPDSGNQYAVTPQPAYKDNSGRDCREAEILTTIDGRAEKTVANACRINGRWVIQ
jgi:surface antigen